MTLMDCEAEEAVASGAEEARALLASGKYLRIRLTWEMNSDEFFRLVTEADVSEQVNIVRDEKGVWLEFTPA